MNTSILFRINYEQTLYMEIKKYRDKEVLQNTVGFPYKKICQYSSWTTLESCELDARHATTI
jgi:hypothetical protein